MFELADYLVGIYKVHDCTNSATIQNFDKQRVLGFGEKEQEKENQDENRNQDSMISCRSSQGSLIGKESNMLIEPSTSQPMDTEN